MDYENYEVLKEMYIGTWEAIAKKMLTRDSGFFRLTDGYSAQISVLDVGFGDTKSYEFKLYGGYKIGLVYGLYFTTSSQSISTFYEKSIGISSMKSEHPRLYSIVSQNVSYMEYPFTEEQYFQASTLDCTLPIEDYKLWDDISTRQRTVLNEHPKKELHEVYDILMSIPNGPLNLTPSEVLELFEMYLRLAEYNTIESVKLL